MQHFRPSSQAILRNNESPQKNSTAPQTLLKTTQRSAKSGELYSQCARCQHAFAGNFTPMNRLSFRSIAYTRSVTFKTRTLGTEGQPHRAGRAITVLADDQFGRTFVWGVGVIDLIPIDEHDDVRILFDGA